MAREILKQSFDLYTEVSNTLEQTDFNWSLLSTNDKFMFCKYPGKTYYVNPISPCIETFYGPYKVFDTLGNIVATNNSNSFFIADPKLFTCSSFVGYLKNSQETCMIFVSNNAVTTEYKEQQIEVNRPQISSISINNTTSQSIFYSYTSEPVEPPTLKEIQSGVIEIIQPTSVEYLYIKTNGGPVVINTNNTRTKLVNNYFLLICPTNYSKAQAAKLTGNPISTIKDELDLFITL